MHDAPVIVARFTNKQTYLDRCAKPDKGFPPNDERRWRIPHWYVDTAFASMVMLLSVVDAGLGAIFFSVRDPAPLREAFGVPDRFDPIGAIAIGYPAQDQPRSSARRGRKPKDEVVHWGRW